MVRDITRERRHVYFAAVSLHGFPRSEHTQLEVGKYFSTSIYEFAMHCGTIVGHERSVDGRVFCNQRMVIRTDPKNADYELVEGACVVLP